MKILILGSGLLGVTAAYELARRGHNVTVLERQSECARETSYANGGQLSYSHAEPWASPHLLPKLPKWLLDPDSPLVFRLKGGASMLAWSLKFLQNCTTARAEANCVNLLRLGLYSRERMAAIRKETGIAFDHGAHGILHLYGNEADLDHARRINDFQGRFGCEQRELSRDECLSMEPALGQTSRRIVGGIHAVMDETGDANLFCNTLAQIAAGRHGVTFHYGVAVKSLRAGSHGIAAVETDRGDFSADAYVMAMGSFSPLYLKPLGIRLPIYPMKGCSVTIAADEHCPNMSLTDGTYKVVYSRLGDRLRLAGTAEFAGYDMNVNEKRIAPVIRAARTLFPRANWDNPILKWACLRPQTPDGPPMLGRTPCPNLFLNTGHGTLGWTQAAGSAAIVADIIEGRPPEIMLNGLTMEKRR